MEKRVFRDLAADDEHPKIAHLWLVHGIGKKMVGTYVV